MWGLKGGRDGVRKFSPSCGVGRGRDGARQNHGGGDEDPILQPHLVPPRPARLPSLVVWDATLLLLCRAPKLQTLTFELTHRCRSQCLGPNNRLKPLDVLECMSSHLTTIHYKGFSEYEMELVEQILKEAKVLKTMNIIVESDLDSKLKLRIHKEIMKFPKAFQNCQIAFD